MLGKKLAKYFKIVVCLIKQRLSLFKLITIQAKLIVIYLLLYLLTKICYVTNISSDIIF